MLRVYRDEEARRAGELCPLVAAAAAAVEEDGEALADSDLRIRSGRVS